MWRWWMIAVLTVTAVAAGPFEKLPRSHAVYPDLARLNDARLLEHSMVVYEPGQELTRFDVAWLWKAAYDQLAAREGRSLATVSQPDPQVAAVATAMLRLLDRFEAELTRMKVDLVDARLLLERLPRRLTSLKTSWGDTAAYSSSPVARTTGLPAWSPPPATLNAPAWLTSPGGGHRPVLTTPGLGGLDLLARRTVAPWSGGRVADESGAHWSTGWFGPAQAGFGLNEVKLFEYDRFGPRELLKGHVLAADLRLQLGDNSVLMEYAQTVDQRWGNVSGQAEAPAFRATFGHQIGDRLQLGIGLRRLNTTYLPYGALTAGPQGTKVTGVEAGLTYHGDRWNVESSGAYLRPDSAPRGYANRFDTEMNYRVWGPWQVSLGYQTLVRRRLLNLEDAWFNYVTWTVSYGSRDALQADLRYRFESGDPTGPYGSDHTIGASLGMGF